MSANKKGLSRLRAGIFSAIPVLAVCTAAAAAYVGFPLESVRSTQLSGDGRSAGDLEDAFWRCDYVATQQGIHAAPVAFCSEVTAQLQDQKFAGDFIQFLEWWRKNKHVEHSKLQSLQVAGASSR